MAKALLRRLLTTPLFTPAGPFSDTDEVQNQSNISITSDMRIAVYHHDLNNGGSMHVALVIAAAFFEAGYEVDFVVNDNDVFQRARIPVFVRVISLRSAGRLRTRVSIMLAGVARPELLARATFVPLKHVDQMHYMPALADYLRKRKPSLIFSNLWQLGLVAVSACSLARTDTRVACIFHSAHLRYFESKQVRSRHPKKWANLFAYCRLVYQQAGALITVSNGIADDLTRVIGLKPGSITTIHNPIVSNTHDRDTTALPMHPWFQSNRRPILVAAGRLSAEKNFVDLISAFAIVKQRLDARLLILGEGDERPNIEAAIRQRALSSSVDMPGWVYDLDAYLTHADLFVLSSTTEGLPTVLIEALACGCPCVSYDCPYGPREILADGAYGELVSPGDTSAFAAAIEKSLANPRSPLALRKRAQAFSVEKGVRSYLAIAEKLIDDKQTKPLNATISRHPDSRTD